MNTIIPPTPGRVVWLYPNLQFMRERGLSYDGGGVPLAATVAYVHGDRMVNLSAVDQRGIQFAMQSVPLMQEGDVPGDGQTYAAWMPYQKGQAAKV